MGHTFMIYFLGTLTALILAIYLLSRFALKTLYTKTIQQKVIDAIDGRLYDHLSRDTKDEEYESWVLRLDSLSKAELLALDLTDFPLDILWFLYYRTSAYEGKYQH